MHVRHAFQHIALPHSAQQLREITKFEVLKTTRAHKFDSILPYFYSENPRTNLFLGYLAHIVRHRRKRWPNRNKLTIAQSYSFSWRFR